MSNVKDYVRFSSDNPRLDFTFLYPGSWRAMETRGRQTTYDEVFIAGPRNRENTFNLALVVRVTPSAEHGGQHDTLETAVADYLAKNRRATNYRELSRAEGVLAGVEAMEFEIGYAMPLPINNLNAKPTPIVERRVFLERAGYFCEIVFSAVEEDYAEYLDVFKNAARTFEFREATTREAYWPVVAPAPAHAVREHPEQFKTDESGPQQGG